LASVGALLSRFGQAVVPYPDHARRNTQLFSNLGKGDTPVNLQGANNMLVDVVEGIGNGNTVLDFHEGILFQIVTKVNIIFSILQYMVRFFSERLARFERFRAEPGRAAVRLCHGYLRALPASDHLRFFAFFVPLPALCVPSPAAPCLPKSLTGRIMGECQPLAKAAQVLLAAAGKKSRFFA
jgi:hypothetical protein